MVENSEKKPTRFENWLIVAILSAVLGLTVVPLVVGKYTREKVREEGVRT